MTKENEEKKEIKKTEPVNSGIGKTVTIAVLATMLGCFVLTFAILMATGVIKFGNTAENTGNGTSTGVETSKGSEDEKEPSGDNGTSTGSGNSSKTSDGLENNPNPRVSVNGTKVEVGDLEFYLPTKFKSGGKNSDGAYTYNLTNDDGWAQVLVYAEKSSLSAAKYLLTKSQYLDITDYSYKMNGTTWVEGETGSMLAYATKLEDKVYAIIYSVKLDSEATSDAMSMIPKTLYMKKIYQD